MIPEGHEPTVEDESVFPETPFEMHYTLILHHGRIACEYTHYSRNEVVGFRQGYIRRFSRGAYDPFEIGKTNLKQIVSVDDSAHVVVKMGHI